MKKDTAEALPPEASGEQLPARREFLGRAAAAAVAVAGVPSLLAACSDSAAPTEPAAAAPITPSNGGVRPSLGYGPNFGQTAHKMVAGTVGGAPDIKVPALEKGSTTTYLQRIITDSDRTGTGLATVLKPMLKSPEGVTVQIVVQDSRGRTWPPRTISKQSDLVYAMKDAMATNPNHLGVHRASLGAGSHVISISKSHIVQFHDSVASDIYGNHNDIMARGMCDLFQTTVSGIKIASTTHDPIRC